MPSESEFSRHRTECDTERKDLCDRLTNLELAKAKEEGAREPDAKWRRWVTRECRRSKVHRARARERWRLDDIQAKRWRRLVFKVCAGAAGGAGGLLYAIKHWISG